jgi:hypothetical protein
LFSPVTTGLKKDREKIVAKDVPVSPVTILLYRENKAVKRKGDEIKKKGGVKMHMSTWIKLTLTQRLPNLILAAPSHALGSSMIEGAHFSLIIW